MDAQRRHVIMDLARAAGFDPLHLSRLEIILEETPPTSLGGEVADIVVDRMRVEGIEYFPQLPHIISNASINAAMGLEHLRMVRGGIEVFRPINRHAVEDVIPHINSTEATLVKIRDSLHQTSQLLIGEELDQNKEGLHE